jgi:hemerythrin
MNDLDDKHKSGITLLDQQHQQLMTMLSHVKTDHEAQKNPKIFLETLVEINELAREHFTFEESLLEKAGSDRLELHCSQHERILYDLNDLILSCMNDELPGSSYTEIVELMTEWFEKHILLEDKYFFDKHIHHYANPLQD